MLRGYYENGANLPKSGVADQETDDTLMGTLLCCFELRRCVPTLAWQLETKDGQYTVMEVNINDQGGSRH
jgi:hypothetical protein